MYLLYVKNPKQIPFHIDRWERIRTTPEGQNDPAVAGALFRLYGEAAHTAHGKEREAFEKKAEAERLRALSLLAR